MQILVALKKKEDKCKTGPFLGCNIEFLDVRFTRRSVTSIQVMGAPWWSLITRAVMPVDELLTAMSPSAAPLMIMHPTNTSTNCN